MGTPERTIASRQSLQTLQARHALRPGALAGERRIPVSGPLRELIPGGGLVRGTVVALDGPTGAGASTLALWLLADATATGEWAGVVDPGRTFGAVAAAEAGVALDRIAVVRGVAPRLWSRVVATLLEGMGLVAAVTPSVLSASDARRLAARARERAAVLVTSGWWPGEAALRLTAEASHWSAIGSGQHSLAGGRFTPAPGIRRLRVAVSGKGAAGRIRALDLAWPPETGAPSRPVAVEVPGPAVTVESVAS